ncbi:OmpA/MotB domain protein [Fibrella aestuarina BUZ 2]|uniref:OmpA/MotB domain protein n=1 Tax=Fibrella aestuarina BUZ 2 TaxID=1166018 RepID=I0KDR8_9BACT|nr:OmpA family protein [Fibrella aestuarina]CCH02271.1 OmpA/MotB domain protein [Fibrella aestuarina BUZ 2]
MRFLLLFLFALPALPTSGQAIKLSDKPTKTVFAIKAIDDKTEADIPAHFIIKTSLARKKFEGNSRVGKEFEFILTRADTLDVIATAKGYQEAEELMVVTCDTCANYGYAIRLEKADSVFRNLQVNQAIRLDKVYFDQSSYHMRPESYEQLDKLVRTLQTQPALSIEIAGHTDNVGDRRLNQLLSENRAKVITNYLVRNGIPEKRLRYNGYGDTRPAAPNDVEENKRKNRRVEFVVLGK